MYQKDILRKKYYNLRKKKYYEINENFFLPLVKFIKSNIKKKFFKLALYYPSNFEINVLKILENRYMLNRTTLLPVIDDKYQMNFFPWKKNKALQVNKYGILQPLKSEVTIPDIILVPLLAFDQDKHRIGYGKGFYDRYLSKLIKKNVKILTVGVAFSFQKYHKLSISKNDVRLDLILTNKGLKK